MKSFFGAVDFVLFGCILLMSLATGVYHGRKQDSSTEFILGNRKMSALPVAISLMASFESAIMMLGVPAEVYFYSAQWIFGVLGAVVGRCLCSFFVFPFIFPLRLTSANSYLEKRFKSRAIKQLGTVIVIIWTMLYMGIALFAPALAMEAVMGFPYWISMVCVTVAAVIYTTLGGIKAVVWTDVLQAMIMYIGMVAFIVKGTMAVGGFSYVWNVNKENGRLDIFNFDLDPTVRHTFWGLFFGEIFSGLTNAFGQATVQRMSSLPNLKAAQRSYYLTAVSFLVILSLAIVEGLVIFAYYFKARCDPLQSRKIKNPNQILPFMVVDIFRDIPGLPGLFLASIICASLSTLSTGLTTSSSLAWEDLIKPCFKRNAERRAVVCNRICVIVLGCIAIGTSFLLSNITGSLSQITRLITASMSGSLEAIFILGCLCPWSNKYGAAVGGVVSTILLSWVTLGQLLSDGVRKTPFLPPAPVDRCFVNSSTDYSYDYSGYPLNFTNFPTDVTTHPAMPVPVSGFPVSGLNAVYSLSYKWIFLVCLTVVTIVGSIVSLITGRTKPGEVESKYLFPVFDLLCCFCSSSSKRVLSCCLPYYEDRKMEINIAADAELKQLNDVKETLEEEVNCDKDALNPSSNP